MRLTHLAVFASITALAACSDAPVTQAEPTDPLAGLTILTPDQYAANGITATPMPQITASGTQPMSIEQPCYVEPCPDPEPPPPPPQAHLDYFTSSTKTNNGTNKTIELWTYQQAHNNMDYMILDARYKVVSAQDWKGCGATPNQFSSDYKTVNGAPTELTGSRFASYPSYLAHVWRIDVKHTFKANSGYVVYGAYNSRTFSSYHQACW
jgi:hypothetical protein